jgi:hypothetical protein
MAVHRLLRYLRTERHVLDHPADEELVMTTTAGYYDEAGDNDFS